MTGGVGGVVTCGGYLKQFKKICWKLVYFFNSYIFTLPIVCDMKHKIRKHKIWARDGSSGTE